MDEVSDATLRKNSEATVFPKIDEGTDVTLQKMSEAAMPPVLCAPAKKLGGSFVWNVLTIRIRLMPYALCLMPYAICHAREKKNPEF
jgi:hypothetical protein